MFRFPVVCVALLTSSLALAQAPGYERTGPYVPLITTPSISLETFSTATAGARNATSGLKAGARNSTLSMNDGNTSSVYTEAVWYSGGGAPLISSPAVSLEVRPMHHPEMHGGMHMEMHDHERAEAGPRTWTYFADMSETSNPVTAASSAKTARKATRIITNDDIAKENEKTGMVKYDGKTEEIK